MTIGAFPSSILSGKMAEMVFVPVPRLHTLRDLRFRVRINTENTTRQIANFGQPRPHREHHRARASNSFRVAIHSM
jgi:hypothetical protein